MASWNEGEEGDNWVTYGAPFSDDETEEGRFRSLQYGKQKNLPAAYEQRVLNERGRPMRFHGAFTGGFSAGYFNTVGSKEGFKPRSFHSSRKARQRDTEEQVVQRPEDFMDDEDFGEFGIAPRRIKMAAAFDDTHVRDSLKSILGGQSIIPDAGSIVKNMIVPSRGPLAERLLRKLGWKDAGSLLTDDHSDTEEQESRAVRDSDKSPAPLYTQICFDAKTNTFGLGYSALDPNLAMGRRQPRTGTMLERHPEESSTALSQRQSSLSAGFNPMGGGSTRVGIRGQAFGVGALEVDDADIYARDDMGDYDFEIGDASADEEEAELEAARAGRWSARKHGGKFDGWTAPSSKSLTENKGNILPGFVSSSKDAIESTKIPNQAIRIPPGYMPVFNPQCVQDPSNTQTPPLVKSQALDPKARGRLLEDSGSVFDHLTPVEQLRLEAAAAGLPVPVRSEVKPQATDPPAVTAGLLKRFKSDPHKQARFEAFQVLLRRGFTADVAYTRCSGAVDMPGDEREHELNSFLTILGLNPKAPPQPESSVDEPTPGVATESRTPLTTQIPLHKQRLVASMLSSRFRSAGCMDISKELTESEEKALRAKVESLENMDPRDHAVATESYGALTRRRLTWHPDKLLCKRINVPDPFPDSTFVGCPDERRPRNPFRRRRFNQHGNKDTGEFSLFDLLDVHKGVDEDESDEDVKPQFTANTTPEPPQVQLEEAAVASLPASTAAPSMTPTIVYNPNPRGAALFACLFDAAEAADQRKAVNHVEEPKTQDVSADAAGSSSSPDPPVGPRTVGPSLPADEHALEESHPPMDLFKSIFASDEELSSSDTEEPVTDSADQAHLTVENSWTDRQFSSEQVEQMSSAHALAHLFGPGGAVDSPLFALSQLTSNHAKLPPNSSSNVEPDSFYGPSLPPPDSLNTEVTISETPDAMKSIDLDVFEDDLIQWKDAKEAKAERKRHKRKHSKRKHKRNKHASKKSQSNPSSTDHSSDSE